MAAIGREVTLTEIRKHDPSRDQGVLEFQPGRTIVKVGSLQMSALLGRDDFTNLFIPDGLWFAVVDSAIIGALVVGPCDSAGWPCVATYGIKVDEPYRRCGIGSQLMQKADEFAELVGIDRLFVETRPDNIPALGLFRKCGYKICESGSDNVTLEKRLL